MKFRKYCDGKETTLTCLGTVTFYCHKRKRHFGKCEDEYGGRWTRKDRELYR